MRFIWDDQYKIGIESIDKQHQYIFELANKIITTHSKNELINCFMHLYEYTVIHFREEEQLMLNAHYSNYEEHRIEHDVMIDSLNDLSIRIHNDKYETDEIEKFMFDWLTKHIAVYDAKLKKCLV